MGSWPAPAGRGGATSEFGRQERDGAIATIRPGRPSVNAIDDGLETGLGTGLGLERLRFPGLLTTGDQRAGMRSFVENGPGKATFTGR